MLFFKFTASISLSTEIWVFWKKVLLSLCKCLFPSFCYYATEKKIAGYLHLDETRQLKVVNFQERPIHILLCWNLAKEYVLLCKILANLVLNKSMFKIMFQHVLAWLRYWIYKVVRCKKQSNGLAGLTYHSISFLLYI